MLLLDYRVHQATVQRHVKMFLITDDRDFRPQTCTNGLVFRECKHIKNEISIFSNDCHLEWRSGLLPKDKLSQIWLNVGQWFQRRFKCHLLSRYA
jgi:hypothetical protein